MAIGVERMLTELGYRVIGSAASADEAIAKAVALAFKLWSDPFVGRLVFARVYQGKLTRGQSVFNPRTRRHERISRLLLMRAMDKEEIDTAYAGDICAVVGVKDAITGTATGRPSSSRTTASAVFTSPSR